MIKVDYDKLSDFRYGVPEVPYHFVSDSGRWRRPFTVHNQLLAPKIKSDTVSTVSPSISHEVMGPPAMIPASGPLQMSQFFTSGGQSIGVSASASVLPMSIQD